MGGGVIRGGFCPKLGQILSRGTTKGPATEVCRPCYLYKSNWRVREVETSGRRVFLGEQKPTTTDWKCPIFVCWRYIKSRGKQGFVF